ncbi:hypothetical protein HZS_3676 [Henneguya salminicola]|nr:hypothetical protein HZS_3676 [Henneguya salminicola]
MIGNLRSRALSSTLAPRHIISERTRILSPNISAILPEYNTLQRNIQKIRQKANMPYPFSRNASDLIIPNEFKNTFSGELFAVVNILSESRERTVIFASNRNLNYLSQSSSIYFDATFKTVPQIFSKLFTAHATNFKINGPCIYALMQRKKGSIGYSLG